MQLELQLAPLLKNQKITVEEMEEIIEKILAGVEKGQAKAKGFVQGLKDLVEEATNLNEKIGEFGVEAIDRFANTFADFVATGKASFREFANSVLADLAKSSIACTTAVQPCRCAMARGKTPSSPIRAEAQRV